MRKISLKDFILWAGQRWATYTYICYIFVQYKFVGVVGVVVTQLYNWCSGFCSYFVVVTWEMSIHSAMQHLNHASERLGECVCRGMNCVAFVAISQIGLYTQRNIPHIYVCTCMYVCIVFDVCVSHCYKCTPYAVVQ